MIENSAAFKHQAVRDLAWAIGSPPLVSLSDCSCVWPKGQWFQQVFRETLPWLNTVDSAPAELEELLAGQRDRRLGKYFETLWFFWLSHHPRYQLIEHNVQIIIDGETLGEMDFIVFDKVTKQTMHWEVAVKFYLGAADSAEMSNWHGPNLRDRLDIKVSHLLHRQSTISRMPRVAQWLKLRGIKIDSCIVVLKGRLYYPWHKSDTWDILHDGMAPLQSDAEYLRSWWLNTRQFEQVFDEKQQFIPLINEGWLERISTASVKNLYSKAGVIETVSNKILRLPLQLKLCNVGRTRDRLFLTGMDWPQK